MFFLVFLVVSLFEGYFEKKHAYRQIEQDHKKRVCNLAGRLQELSEYFINKKDVSFIERRIADISADQFLMRYLYQILKARYSYHQKEVQR